MGVTSFTGWVRYARTDDSGSLFRFVSFGFLRTEASLVILLVIFTVHKARYIFTESHAATGAEGVNTRHTRLRTKGTQRR